MGKIRHELWTFCKAQATAQVATAVDFVVTLLMAEAVGLWYVWSSFLGALTGGIVNCTMNYRWVFDHTNDLKKRSIAWRYSLVWAGSIFLNTMGTFILTELSGTYFLFAKIAMAVTVALLWNYQLQRRFVFK